MLVSKEVSKNVVATNDFTSPLAGEVCFQVEHERNLENRERGKIDKLDCFAFARNDGMFLRREREEFVNECNEFTNSGEGSVNKVTKLLGQEGTKNLRHSERSEESHNKVSELVSKEVSKSVIATNDFTSPLEGEVCFQVEPERNLENRERGKRLRNDRNLLLTYLPTNFLTCKRYAFTLAEVLITLGIIGVVAAMTIPTLIQKHNNLVVETRLQKFYSTINQAILLAELDYGDREYWYNTDDVDFDKDGNSVTGNSTREKWVNKYITPYMKNIKTVTSYYDNATPLIYFVDGSSLFCRHGTSLADWIFYPGDFEKCNSKFGSSTTYQYKAVGRCGFAFSYYPVKTALPNWRYVGRNFEPYKYAWDGTVEGLYNNDTYAGCNEEKRMYCTTAIQLNGWKIPKRYPFKVSY